MPQGDDVFQKKKAIVYILGNAAVAQNVANKLAESNPTLAEDVEIVGGLEPEHLAETTKALVARVEPSGIPNFGTFGFNFSPAMYDAVMNPIQEREKYPKHQNMKPKRRKKK